MIRRFHRTSEIKKATLENDIDKVKLLSNTSSREENTKCLLTAIEHNYTEIFDILLPISFLQSENSRPLWTAARYNRIDFLKQLIPHTTDVYDFSVAMIDSFCARVWKKGEPEEKFAATILLLPHSDIEIGLSEITHGGLGEREDYEDEFMEFYHNYESSRQKTILLDNIDNMANENKKRKI